LHLVEALERQLEPDLRQLEPALRQIEVVERVGQMAIVLGARVETTSLAPTAPGGGEVKRTIIGNKS
jgi:hypothetical protein